MGTTANYLWPYPASTEVPDVPTDMKDLADAIDATVDSIDDRCDGYEAAWTTYTPTWAGATTNPVIGNGTLTGAYRQIGKTIWVRITMTMGTTTTYGSGGWTWTLPSQARTVAGHSFPVWTGGMLMRDISASTYHSTHMWSVLSGGTTIGTIPTINSTSPMTWASTDYMTINVLYEAA